MTSRKKRERRQPDRRQRRRWLLPGLGALFVIFVVGMSLFSTGLLGSREASADLAPDVTLATFQGDLQLSRERGKVVVLYFSFPG